MPKGRQGGRGRRREGGGRGKDGVRLDAKVDESPLNNKRRQQVSVGVLGFLAALLFFPPTAFLASQSRSLRPPSAHLSHERLQRAARRWWTRFPRGLDGRLGDGHPALAVPPRRRARRTDGRSRRTCSHPPPLLHLMSGKGQVLRGPCRLGGGLSASKPASCFL